MSVPYTKLLHITWNIVHCHDVFTAFFEWNPPLFIVWAAQTFCLTSHFAIYRRKITEGQNRTRVSKWWHENGHLWVNSSFTVILSATLHDAMEESSSLQSFKPFTALRFQCTYCNVSWYATLSGLGWFAMPLGCICYVDTSLITQDAYT